MPERRLHPDVRLFIARHVDSVGQVEMIGLLHDHPERAWTPHEFAARLRAPVAWSSMQLDRLRRMGLVRVQDGSNPVYVYDPSNRRTARVVDRLVEAFDEDRSAVVGEIMKPGGHARAFADAFRFRRRRPRD